MISSKNGRNGYIDVIKFIFALIIADFHFNSGVFKGGRIAVEGFFMISGYLMMCSLSRDRSRDSIAISTCKFIWKKYKSLFYFLFPSAIIAFCVCSYFRKLAPLKIFQRLGLLLFEIFPMYGTGLQGEYVVGISWYLSSMLIALAILYPLTKRFRRSFTLLCCPFVVIFGYGVLAHYFGSMAVNYQYIPETIFNSGIIRGLAGCSLGCLLYEASSVVSSKEPTKIARIIFTIAEVCAFAYFIYQMCVLPKTIYDFISIVAIFIFLWIGISGLSYTSYLWRFKWTKALGTISTLIVLNHYYWNALLEKTVGADSPKSSYFGWYILLIAISCAVVYLASIVIKLIFSRLGKIKLWKNDEVS